MALAMTTMMTLITTTTMMLTMVMMKLIMMIIMKIRVYVCDDSTEVADKTRILMVCEKDT